MALQLLEAPARLIRNLACNNPTALCTLSPGLSSRLEEMQEYIRICVAKHSPSVGAQPEGRSPALLTCRWTPNRLQRIV